MVLVYLANLLADGGYSGERLVRNYAWRIDKKVPALAAIPVILMMIFSIYPGGRQQIQEVNNFMKINPGSTAKYYAVGFIGFVDSVLLKVRAGFIAFSSDIMFYLTKNLREFTLYGKTYFL